MAKVEKGYLKNESTGGIKKFIYNPELVSEGRSVNFTTISAPGCSYPKFQYVNGGEKTISLSLFLNGDNTSSYIDFLEGLLPPKQTGGSFSPPPLVLFAFGQTICRCILTNLSVDKTEFTSDLKVKQAIANLSLTEVV